MSSLLKKRRRNGIDDLVERLISDLKASRSTQNSSPQKNEVSATKQSKASK